uniref:Uncharacterized protein n=1 Tax=Picocystis salinarum TaxID=88271 RepID=A0A7S3UBR5_9CHLO
MPPTTALASNGAPSNVALATHVAKKVATPLPPLRCSSSGRPSDAHCLSTRTARSALSVLQLFAGFLLFATTPCRTPRRDRVPRRTRNHPSVRRRSDEEDSSKRSHRKHENDVGKSPISTSRA